MGTLREVKRAIKQDPETKGMLVRGSLHEILLDLDGDGSADIALIDLNRDGDIDMVGVDITGNGEFNLYVGDADANGIPDTVEFYADGDDMPEAAYFGRNVEDRFIDMADIVFSRIMMREIVIDELLRAFEEFEERAEDEYEQVMGEEQPAYEAEPAEEAAPAVEAAGCEE